MAVTGNTSMNLQLALSQAATVYYVIIPSSSATSASRGLKQSSDSTGSSSWQSIGADKVVQAAAAQGQTEVEVSLNKLQGAVKAACRGVVGLDRTCVSGLAGKLVLLWYMRRVLTNNHLL